MGKKSLFNAFNGKMGHAQINIPPLDNLLSRLRALLFLHVGSFVCPFPSDEGKS